LNKLESNAELAALLPAAVESIPQIREITAKKAENRPITPEEYTALGQFVDRVERRTLQIKEEAARAEEERNATARAEVPEGAFKVPLEQAGIREHIFNILTEAGFETVGDLMFTLKTDSNKVLGLAGIGSKAMQNIEEALAVLTFPEPEAEAAPAAVEEVPAAEVVVDEIGMTPEEIDLSRAQAEAKKEAKRHLEEEQENEFAKDGVSLDELFKMKPEIFQNAAPVEDDSADKKKGKKDKKKSVELVLDEDLGKVVGHKKHKRGEEGTGEDW
jgi:N utilization substance protein A